ncbi:threonine/serine exporter family protein [Candidatus Saccharibacteria bacterium]|nr:MAG: threonine/serine exporter family protein [Candidatus Saccharibacteria bacterium]
MIYERAITPAATDTQKVGRDLTPNMRALRLTMRIAEQLLCHGVSAHDVVDSALDITETLCQRRVHIDINATSIMASQDRGIDREPLTLIRTVSMQNPNNLIVQEMQDLVRSIRGGLSLDSAEARFEKIIAVKPTYPSWLTMIGNASVTAGATMLFTNSWVVVVTTFLVGCLVDRLIRWLEARQVLSFFVQAISSFTITMSATLVVELGNRGVWPFVGVNPTLIVVGGIVMLVAGLMVVATAQDAIDEFYVTASARFMKTFMMTAGIVMGIVIGLLVAHGAGSKIAVSPDPVALGDPFWQVMGAVVIAAGWALFMQSKAAAVVWAGIIGGLGWGVYMLTAASGEALANGVAAVLVGFAGAIIARVYRSPSIALIDAGVVPLVPGLALYNGLMQFVDKPSASSVAEGNMLLLTALSVALSIAAGASVGNYFGRPVRSHIVRVKESIPEMMPTFRRKR